MDTPKDVLIAGDRHLIVHGQLGNLQAKIDQLGEMLKVEDGKRFIPHLVEIDTELTFLKEYYPDLAGGIRVVPVRSGRLAEEAPNFEIKELLQATEIRKALKDMRLLIDAAYLSYQHEGNIDCHLKVMLDEAWGTAASLAGVAPEDDLPF